MLCLTPLACWICVMRIKKEKCQFVLKLITNYFLYGYLCFFGVLILGFAGYHIYRLFAFPKNLFSISFIVCSLPVLGQFLRIVFSTHHKYRYYKLSCYRLKTRRYKDEYFECEMHEPCFRLIIKDLLKSNGYSKEYYKLRDKTRGKNLRVERARERLLAKVMKEHEEKAI